jgi:hypothetical protein
VQSKEVDIKNTHLLGLLAIDGMHDRAIIAGTSRLVVPTALSLSGLLPPMPCRRA